MTQGMNLRDHDQRFKTLIREFFADFLRLFFNEWAVRFDLSEIEWLNTEMLPNPPEGSRHALDLVAKLRALEPIAPNTSDDPLAWLALVHIEVESQDYTTRLKPRLPAYALHLRERYQLPVLPIVLYQNVGLDGIGRDSYVEHFWELEVHRFTYLYVGLPRLSAEDYVQGESVLGVALSALMKIPEDRVRELGRQVFERLNTADVTEQQQYLLTECAEAYLPLLPSEVQAIRAKIEPAPKPEDPEMQRHRNPTSFDRALEEVEQRGEHKGRRLAQIEMLEAMLETRFGKLSEESLAALRAKPEEELLQLGIKILSVQSLAELGL